MSRHRLKSWEPAKALSPARLRRLYVGKRLALFIKSLFSRRYRAIRRPPRLDAWPPADYTSAVPEMDGNNPRAGLSGYGSHKDFAMSRRCELTAKGPQVGHRVSHSNIKTTRRFLPTLVTVTFISEALERTVRLRVSTNAVESV